MEFERVALDTDTVIDYLRKRPAGEKVKEFQKKAEVYITSITSFELYYGA